MPNILAETSVDLGFAMNLILQGVFAAFVTWMLNKRITETKLAIEESTLEIGKAKLDIEEKLALIEQKRLSHEFVNATADRNRELKKDTYFLLLSCIEDVLLNISQLFDRRTDGKVDFVSNKLAAALMHSHLVGSPELSAACLGFAKAFFSGLPQLVSDLKAWRRLPESEITDAIRQGMLQKVIKAVTTCRRSQLVVLKHMRAELLVGLPDDWQELEKVWLRFIEEIEKDYEL